MNKLCLLILFTTISFQPFAQKYVSVFSVMYSQAEKIVGAKCGDYFFIKTEAVESTYFYMISPLGNMVNSYSIREENITVLGSTINEDEIKFYFLGKKSKHFYTISFSKTRKSFNQHHKIPNDHSYIGAVYNEKDFYALAFDKKVDNLLVNKLTGDSISAVHQFEIGEKDLARHFKNNTFSFIPDKKEVPLDSGRNRNKSYLRDSTIVLVSDNWNGKEVAETKIITLDLVNSLIGIKSLFLPYDKGTDHNSFLYDNKLFVLGIQRIILGLNIYDFPSLEKVNEHRYLKGHPIPFKSSDLMENEKNWDKELKGKWSEEVIAEQTLRVLNKDIPVITVYRADSLNVRLLIGRIGAQPVKATILDSPPPSYSPSTGTFYGGQSGLALFGNNKKPEPIDQAYFYGYLNSNDFSVPSVMNYKEHGSFYQAEKRINKISKDTKIGGSGVIATPGGGYLIYLNKLTKNIVLEKI